MPSYSGRGLDAFVIAGLLSPIGVLIFWALETLYERGFFKGIL
jgi:hypothetical protein